jgi:hypothetical protein
MYLAMTNTFQPRGRVRIRKAIAAWTLANASQL